MVMEEIYKTIMGSDIDLGVMYLFENQDLPPGEEVETSKDEGEESEGMNRLAK